jgi:nitroreductase
MHSDARAFDQRVNRRRTVPSFTPDPVPRDIIEQCLLAAGTAPSGAHQQPWHFVVVEDRQSSGAFATGPRPRSGRVTGATPRASGWRRLRPSAPTNTSRFLEIAPYLIVIFAQAYAIDPNCTRRKHYYVQESVGIATGLRTSSCWAPRHRTPRRTAASALKTPQSRGSTSTTCVRPG